MRPLKQWKTRQLDLPFTIDLDRVEKDQSLKETVWGQACMTVSGKGTKPFVYIYGTQQKTKFNRHLILARVPAAAIEDFSKWRFFAGNNQWSTELAKAATLADGMAAEFSIEQIVYQGKQKYVMVQSHPMLGSKIFVRTAEEFLDDRDPL